ncbi:S-adenosyl-L-methionine-dependent methyltransferase [Polyplosphaeria fusca]|uniref:S-adenosyl-L-methionine-dependent methyltransferase n=1 Tax=Polyplosphaeria fusca TaxID=682080 RepID=A0A9P4R643_9PLEO|nr:S-adenosyl-L-methionine-dependent methyltransferase [Polyplosphaeria fusca]
MTYTSGQSLASSVTRYRYENGRRYHAFRDGSYYGPNDEKTTMHESIVHHLWLLTLRDKLFLAPLDNPQLILDVGTGTGLWAIDMADHFPGAEIIATDLSPTQISSAPPNIRFEVDDACSEWTYPENSFDFVHVRGLTGCVRDWDHLYAQAFKHLKPGAHFEHLEFSITTTDASPPPPNSSPTPASLLYTQFSTSILTLGDTSTGQTFRTISSMPSYFARAGFRDITSHSFIWPIGPWPSDPHLKELGRWGERNWVEGFEGWVLALYTRVLGWKYEDVMGFVERMKGVVRDRRNHWYHEVRCVYGRKPVPGEEEEEEAKEGGKEGKQS